MNVTETAAVNTDDLRSKVEAADLEVVEVRENPTYGFLSGSARGATETFGVKSVSLLARQR